MLKADSLFLSYGDKIILSNVSLEIPQGEILGIVGKSGMGKTSLLKVLSANLDVSKGTVSFDGERLIGPTNKLIPGYEELQLVNQDFALDLYHTVEENIRVKVLHLPKDDQLVLIDEVLSLLDLEEVRAQKAILLSGGEQQRLALARALACEPRYLLLDEPFVHLDQALRLRVMNYLLKLNEIRKTSIVLVSHDGAELMGFVHKLLHLMDGRIDRIATPLVLFYQPNSREQGELLGIINELRIEGQKVLFRPNEYASEGEGTPIEITFVRSMNTGLIVLNYFKTKNGEQVVLSSERPLQNFHSFYIAHHGVH